MRNDSDGLDATDFCCQHREAMDEGADAAWPARHNPDERSAVQHTMNLKLRDESAFWAEYQNEPLPQNGIDQGMLTVEEIAAKTTAINRGEVPVGVSYLTMFIDVQATLLH